MADKNKTILVTGGAGFIGSHLSKKLIELGFDVIIIDNFNEYYDPRLKEDRISMLLAGMDFKVYRMNISNSQELKRVFDENRIDIICHLAAQAGVRYSLENPYVYEDSNLRGTLNLLELAKENKAKGFIFASSSSVYGEDSQSPFSEGHPCNKPISLYAATKKAGEEIVFSYHHMYKMPATILRFFSVYGPFWRPDLALCKFATAIKNNKAIDVYNFGRMKRDFTYIDDIVSGIVSAIEKNYFFEIFNLGRGEPVELLNFILLIEKELGQEAKKNMLPMQTGDVPDTCADILRARAKLNYNPKVEVEEGVKRTINWYKNYLEKYGETENKGELGPLSISGNR